MADRSWAGSRTSDATRSRRSLHGLRAPT
jgi:hypothetical protein